MISAFLFGFLGSFHCAGMCGPLILMSPVVGSSRSSFLASKFVYQAGRIFVYALFGLFFGLVGESIVLVGFQRWLSVIAGIAMLIGVSAAGSLKTPLGRVPRFVKSLFGAFLRRPTYKSIFALGATNGLLPCGLVYMAAIASVAVGNIAGSIGYMLLFGAGTLPMLLGVSLAGSRLNFAKFPALQRLVPITLVTMAIFLIIRGEPISLAHRDPREVKCALCRPKS